MNDVKFLGYKCEVKFAKYADGKRHAIVLCDAENGERVAVATVNLPEFPLADDEVFIKYWSENEGIKNALCDAGIIEDTGERVPTGWVEANVCKLLVKP